MARLTGRRYGLLKQVDVKSADCCDYGCKFCYRNSSNEGVQAQLARIKDVSDGLGTMSVLEIATGGETELHQRAGSKWGNATPDDPRSRGYLRE